MTEPEQARDDEADHQRDQRLGVGMDQVHPVRRLGEARRLRQIIGEQRHRNAEDRVAQRLQPAHFENTGPLQRRSPRFARFALMTGVVCRARLRPLGFGAAAFATRGLAWPSLAERAKAGAGGGTRTHTTLPSRDFKSLASTSSATSALARNRRYLARLAAQGKWDILAESSRFQCFRRTSRSAGLAGGGKPLPLRRKASLPTRAAA